MPGFWLAQKLFVVELNSLRATNHHKNAYTPTATLYLSRITNHHEIHVFLPTNRKKNQFTTQHMHIFDKKIKRVLSNWLHACVPSIVIYLCRHNVYGSVFSLHPSGFFPFLQFSVPRILRPIFIQCPRSL